MAQSSRSSRISWVSGRSRRRIGSTGPNCFDLPGRGRAQRAKLLDGRLPASLLALPQAVTATVPVAAYQSLAVRDLLRGQATGLPAGEELARSVRLMPLSTEDGLARFGGRTPLWLYLLKEAQVRAGGDRLGPLGALIVAEVLIGLIRADDASWLAVDPQWTPSLPAAGPRFGLADLIVFAESVATGSAGPQA